MSTISIKFFIDLIIFDRNYALRRIRDAFRENKRLSQPDEIQKQFKFANENLNVIRRQVYFPINMKIKKTFWLDVYFLFETGSYWQSLYHRQPSDRNQIK